jgi:tRNA (cmo5U34)-methyltransferase
MKFLKDLIDLKKLLPNLIKDLSLNIDKVFSKEIEKSFQFDESVASVFDDMLQRSVPFYSENINLIVKIADKFLENGDQVVDLGCSTASLLLQIEREVKKELRLLGVDNSQPMLEQAERKIFALKSSIKLQNGDILNIQLPKSKVIIMNYTLQFIRPIYREELLKNIFNSLEDGGILLLSEKIISCDSHFNKKLIDIYYDYKRSKGYSDYEISQKREALENVLVPYTERENIRLLKSVGFREVETVFKWANFSTFIAFN